jgi:hypothetical protein
MSALLVIFGIIMFPVIMYWAGAIVGAVIVWPIVWIAAGYRRLRYGPDWIMRSIDPNRPRRGGRSGGAARS